MLPTAHRETAAKEICRLQVNDETALVVRHYFLHCELYRLPVKPHAYGGVSHVAVVGQRDIAS